MKEHKIGSLHIGVGEDLRRIAVGDLAPRHQHHQPLREACHRAHDVLDHDDRHAACVHPHEQRQDLVDLGLRKPRHRLVDEEQARLGDSRASEIELAQVDLGQVRGHCVAACRKADEVKRLVDRAGVPPGPSGEEERHAQVLSDRQPAKGARQLETAHEASANALMRRKPVDAPALEPDSALTVAGRA